MLCDIKCPVCGFLSPNGNHECPGYKEGQEPYRSPYHGITYLPFLDQHWIHKLWKRWLCPKGIHLLDECWDVDTHFLSCDACDLEIGIKYIKKGDA